ncbi:hypothetical protein V2J09_018650 [Rumex salicifolius]
MEPMGEGGEEPASLQIDYRKQESAPQSPPEFDPSRMIGIIRRKALIKDLAAVYHAECLAYCQELLELQTKWEETYSHNLAPEDVRKSTKRPNKRSEYCKGTEQQNVEVVMKQKFRKKRRGCGVVLYYDWQWHIFDMIWQLMQAKGWTNSKPAALVLNALLSSKPNQLHF